MSFFEELDTLDPRNTKFTSLIELPTPHKVAILLLVQQFINVKRAASDGGLEYRTEPRRNFSMMILKLMQYPDMSYKDLYHVITSHRFKVDIVHLEAFKSSMADLFAGGIENIFDFAEVRNVERMMNDNLGVSQYSLVGLYVRRVGIVLERLNFPEVMALYQNVCMYYNKGLRSLAIGPTKMHTSSEYLHYIETSDEDSKSYEESDDDIDEYDDDDYKLFNMSGDTMEESLLDTDTVHQDRSNHNKWSTKQAELFVKQQSSLLEYNEVRALDPVLLEHKIREIIQDNPLNSNAYFLSYMNKLRLRDYFSSIDAMHRSFDRSPSHLMLCTENKGFQFFCLNLAVMHATYNHCEESLNILKECVMIAQECGDRRCLDLANSWYCYLNNNKIDPFEKSLPDDQDQNSLALAIQFVVKFGAQCCYQPMDLFELLQKTDEIITKNNKLENICDSVALRAALWSLYGRFNVASLYSQMLLNMRKTWTFGDIGNCESVSKVLASQGMWYNLQAETQLSAVLLHHAKERFPRYPIANDWMTTNYIISIQHAIYRCSWEEAIVFCSQLFLIDELLANYHLASVFLARRYFSSARILIENILKIPYLDILTYVRCVQLLSYCSINEQNFTPQTIDMLLTALSITVDAHMEYEHAILDLIIAEILLRFGFPDKAVKLMRSCLHVIFINGGVYQKAKADFALVRCFMAEAKTLEAKKRCFLRGFCHLERALNDFKMLEAHPRVLDVLSFMSTNFNKFGLIKQRNKYACQFKQYISEHPTGPEYFDMIF